MIFTTNSEESRLKLLGSWHTMCEYVLQWLRSTTRSTEGNVSIGSRTLATERNQDNPTGLSKQQKKDARKARKQQQAREGKPDSGDTEYQMRTEGPPGARMHNDLASPRGGKHPSRIARPRRTNRRQRPTKLKARRKRERQAARRSGKLRAVRPRAAPGRYGRSWHRREPQDGPPHQRCSRQGSGGRGRHGRRGPRRRTPSPG